MKIAVFEIVKYRIVTIANGLTLRIFDLETSPSSKFSLSSVTNLKYTCTRYIH